MLKNNQIQINKTNENFLILKNINFQFPIFAKVYKQANR